MGTKNLKLRVNCPHIWECGAKGVNGGLYNNTVYRGTVLNGAYGTHKDLPGIYFAIFTNNIWSYLIWSPVIKPNVVCRYTAGGMYDIRGYGGFLLLRGAIINRTYGIQKNIYQGINCCF